MALLEIQIYPEPVLRQKAAPIAQIDDEIKTLASNMAQTMYAAPGVGLAAPQVGQSVRLIVVDIQSGEGGGELLTLINPKIVKADGEIRHEEGCLSVPDVREEVKRANAVTVEALDLDGKELTIEAEDFFAVVLQHEIDHLNGVLFIDHLSRLKQSMVKKRLKKAAAEKD
jgi:peptide deformylase